MKRVERNQRKSIFKLKGFKQALSLIMILFMCLVLLPVRPIEAAGETYTVYFDASGNTNASWNINDKIYVYGFNNKTDNSGIQEMRISSRGENLWEFPFEKNFSNVIFLKSSNFPSGTDQSAKTVDLGIDWSLDSPCFKLDGSYDTKDGAKKGIWRDLGPNTKQGSKIGFVDMADSLSISDIVAVFATDENFTNSTEVKLNVNGEVKVPNDIDSVPYKYVKFRNNSGDLSEKFDFFNGNLDTYYYSIKDVSGSNVISYWGNSTTQKEASLSNKVLYIDSNNSGWGNSLKIKYNNQEFELSFYNNTSLYSYTFPSDIVATTNTKITISDGTNNFRFMWDLSTGKNKIKLEQVSEITKENLKDKLPLIWDKQVFDRTVYFDSSQSKTSFSDIDENGVENIPRNGGNVYYLAWNSKDTNDYITGPMTQLSGYINGTAIDESVQNKKYNYTYQNIWSIDLPGKYDKIVFCNNNENNKTPNNLNESYIGSTKVYDIPANLRYPCFYVNLTDNKSYDVNKNRTGYFDELTNVNTNGDTSELIPTGTEKKDKDILYLNTTFYDYYSDQELSGNNRQNTEADLDVGYYNKRYINHRMFDIALSDYYSQNTNLTPLYTGHFQWIKENSSTPVFADVSESFKSLLPNSNYSNGLYGYSGDWEYKVDNLVKNTYNPDFYYNNNSQFYKDSYVGLNPNADQKKSWNTSAAIQGLVAGKDSPYFNKEFLRGDNSLHTAIGQVYEDVSFPFVKNSDGYWEFNSYDSTQSLRMTYDKNKDSYFLNRVGSENAVHGFTNDKSTEKSNFFPFNDKEAGENTAKSKGMDKLNYGFGCKIQLKFRLTDNGKIDVVKSDGTIVKDQDIIFNFSGDDDVYVYIDDELALDIGGSHGAVSGEINFADKKARAITKTATVNQIKNGNTFTSNVTTNFNIKGDNTSEHTLTMYYMERGYWESNMKITFNFPIQNDLEVEKEVKLPKTYPLFDEAINNINKIGFDFDIKNLATSGESKPVSAGDTDIEIPAQNIECEVEEVKLPNNVTEKDVLTVKKETYDGRENVVSWESNKAGSSNLTADEIKSRTAIIIPTGGKLDISSAMNVEGVKHYMEFDTRLVSKQSNNISDPYIELVDNNNNVIKAWTSVAKYSGSNNMEFDKWKTIQVDLDTLKAQNPQFNFANIKEIHFAYWDKAKIYIDNIKFKSEEKLKATNVFGIDEANISDYGSIGTNELKPADGAKYTFADKDSKTSIKRISDGKITLKNKEIATFVNQFRTGSYIYINEKGVNPDVFDTSWTIYENGKVVDPDWLTGNSEGINSLENVKGTTVNDGRIEKSYGRKPQNSLLFRSYENPDNTTSGRNINVKVSNELKTGSIKILKTVVKDDKNLLGDKAFNFTIKFNNVAGMSLEEGKTISESFSLKSGDFKEIKGIPAGTEYVIYENLDKELDKNVAIDSIEIAEGCNDTISESNNIIKGIVVADEENVEDIRDIIEFKNRPQNSIEITKVELGSEKVIEESEAKFKIQRVKDGVTVPEDISDDFLNNKENFSQEFGESGEQEKITEKGILKFDNLPNGTYIITETQAPEGYIKLEKPFKVTLPFEYKAGYELGNGIIAQEGGTQADIKLNVYNTKGVELPRAGFKGIWLYLLIGTSIMILSLGFYSIKLRKTKKVN